MMLLLAAVVLLWGVVEAADSCHFPVTETRRQRLLENMCAGRGDDPTLLAHRRFLPSCGVACGVLPFLTLPNADSIGTHAALGSSLGGFSCSCGGHRVACVEPREKIVNANGEVIYF